MKVDINRIYTGKRVTIIGGGPSLEGFDFKRLRGDVIVTNNAVYDYPSAGMLVAIDATWIRENNEKISFFRGIRITDKTPSFEGWYQVYYTPDYVFRNLDWHCMKANLSGYTALALAFYLGATKVVLLGFDGGFSGERSNYHDRGLDGVNSSAYEKANELYDQFKAYPVLNVGITSRISSFKKAPLETQFYDFI
jgi:hypothetical protein